MTARWESALEGTVERSWWHRLATSAVLVGAGIGWTSLWVATVVAAPLSLALDRSDPAAPDHRDDF